MGKQRSKIALYGLYGWGSLGDASVQESVISFLHRERPDAEIFCVCPNPEDATKRFGLPAFPIARLPGRAWPGQQFLLLKWFYRIFLRIPLEIAVALRPIRRLAGFEMLVINGGGQLEDYGVSPWRYPWDLFKWSLAARLNGVTLIVLSVGAGPLRHPLSRWFVAQTLKRAEFRSYRDGGSRDFLTSIGLPYGDDPVTPDLAFGLPISDDVQALAQKRDGRKPTVVGVTGMSYYDPRGWPLRDQAVYDKFLSRMTDFTVWLIEHDYGVRFLVGDVWSDRQTVEDIQAALTARGVEMEDGQVFAAPIYSVPDLVREVAQVDFVVSSRFHVILFGFLLQRPAISIAYNQKSDSIMRAMGLDNYCHQISDFDPLELAAQIQRLEEERDRLVPVIARRVSEYRARFEEVCCKVFVPTS
jgi:polysaccharide pyruvyl transferase WcaK-like protein